MSEQLVTLASRFLLAMSLLATSRAQAGPSDPFRVANLNPPVAVLGLPLWTDVADQLTIGMTTEVANHYRLSQRNDDRLRLDGETLRLRVYVEKPLEDGWSLGIDVPFFRQSGGILDDLVDLWHSAFNMPDGSRNLRPESVLEFDLANADGQFFSLNETASGIGDIQLSIARELGDDSGWVVRGAVKLPTGRKQVLAGSGGTDLSLGVLRVGDGRLGARPAGYYYGMALMDVAQPENVLFPVDSPAAVAILGGGIALGQRLGLKAQIDAHPALYDSELKEIGRTAVMVTLGGWLDVGDNAVFEFGIGEDLQVGTTPDVAIVFNLNWKLQ